MGIRSALGVNPTLIRDNVYSPSRTSISVMQKVVPGYKKHEFSKRYEGGGKVLVACTQESELKTANGRIFLTGNHPIETYVPLLHMESVGIDYEIATPTGEPATIEEWAIPKHDQVVVDILERAAPQRAAPVSFSAAIDRMRAGEYCALLIPGGHGAVLGLPQDENMGEILKHFMQNDLHIISLCHGPAVFLAAAEKDAEFIFKGYSIAAFPDFLDKQMTLLGYLPGQMPWFFCERLKKLGVTIVNKLSMGSTHVDGKLITGDGPMASNAVGKLAVNALIEDRQRSDH